MNEDKASRYNRLKRNASVFSLAVSIACVIALMTTGASVALRDVAERTATRVAPGSHRWDIGRKPASDELVAAEMPAGSAVIYLGSTLHGGGANTTPDVFRRGMHGGMHAAYTPERF